MANAAKVQTAIEWLADAGVDVVQLNAKLSAISDSHAAKIIKDKDGNVVKNVLADAPSAEFLANVVKDYITPDAIAKLVDEVVQEWFVEFAARDPVTIQPDPLPAEADVTPPATPAEVVVTQASVAAPQARVVHLSWKASEEPDLAGYNLYRSSSEAGPFSKMNAAPLVLPAFDDSVSSADEPLWYQVSAVDTSGNESAASSVVSAAAEIAA